MGNSESSTTDQQLQQMGQMGHGVGGMYSMVHEQQPPPAFPDMNMIFKSFPKMVQATDDMHRMTNYMRDLRNMMFAMSLITAIGVVLFVVFKYCQSKRDGRRRRRRGNHTNTSESDTASLGLTRLPNNVGSGPNNPSYYRNYSSQRLINGPVAELMGGSERDGRAWAHSVDLEKMLDSTSTRQTNLSLLTSGGGHGPAPHLVKMPPHLAVQQPSGGSSSEGGGPSAADHVCAEHASIGGGGSIKHGSMPASPLVTTASASSISGASGGRDNPLMAAGGNETPRRPHHHQGLVNGHGPAPPQQFVSQQISHSRSQSLFGKRRGVPPSLQLQRARASVVARQQSQLQQQSSVEGGGGGPGSPTPPPTSRRSPAPAGGTIAELTADELARLV